MLKQFGISEQLKSGLETVETQVTTAYNKGTNQSEDRISGHLAGILSVELDETFTSGSDQVDITVDSFEGTDEPRSGVDIGLRYQLDTDEFKISTGMIIQSKRFGSSDPLLRDQCYKMLSRSQESYIFTYSSDSIEVIPALPVYCDQGTGGKYTKYYQRDFVSFLRGFLEGYHGDIPIADTVDQPADAFPIPERANYIIDIKAKVNRAEGNFSTVDRDSYRRIRRNEQY